MMADFDCTQCVTDKGDPRYIEIETANGNWIVYDQTAGAFLDASQLDGFFGKIGSAFKKIGKMAAPIAAGFIPGVGQFASMGVEALVNRGGGSSDAKMEKDCAKKPSKKGCKEYFANKQAAQQAFDDAKREKEQQQAIQLEMLKALKENKSGGGGEIGGIPTNYLLIGGGAFGLLMLFMMMRKQ